MTAVPVTDLQPGDRVVLWVPERDYRASAPKRHRRLVGAVDHIEESRPGWVRIYLPDPLLRYRVTWFEQPADASVTLLERAA